MNNTLDIEEIKRLETLLSYNILDTPYEKDFDDLVRLMAIICDTPIAIISMMDDRRQWYKAKIGIDINEVPKAETFCKYAILQDDIMEIPDATKDDMLKNNPLVTGGPEIRFYAGLSIKGSNGYNIGTVCVIDDKPKKLTPEQREALRLLTNQVTLLLEARKKNVVLGDEVKKLLEEKTQETRNELIKKEAEYNYLLNAIRLSSGVVEFSPSGIILQANDLFLHTVGYKREELEGKHHSILLGEPEKEDNRKSWDSLKEGDFKAGRFKRLHKDGRELWFQATYNPVLDLDGEVTKVISISHNITREIESEKTMQDAKNLAESLNVQKTQFIANVSHEIRTPIHAILGYTELLLEQEKDKDKKAHLLAVKTAGDNLLFIINEILELSKIDAGIIQLDNINFDLKHVIKNVFAILELKAKEKNLQLSYEVNENVPVNLLGAKNRLTQVLTNLLGNAVKFTNDGSVRLFVKLINQEDDKATIEFKVSDTGMGISEDKLNTIFERFSQADESISRKYGGTGLGLSISRQLIEKQNGSISVESVEGKGTDFIFTIPYDLVEAGNQENLEATENQTRIKKNARILLCEDNELNQRLISSILTEEGCTVDVAENGIKGMELFKAHHYDLIFMDIQMPEKDGYQTTQEIRNDFNSEVIIVALTANSFSSEKEKCIKHGMDDYLSKPFAKKDLLIVLDRWLAGKVRNTVPEKKVARTSYSTKLSFEHLEELSGGDKNFQKEMINLFMEQSPKLMTELDNAFMEEDFVKLKATAHKIKTSFGIIGADTSILNSIENLVIRDCDNARVAATLEGLRQQFKDLFFILNDKINPKS